MDMEVHDQKVEIDDSAYGSFANNSRNSQGSIKSLTSSWSSCSGYDQPAESNNGHTEEEKLKNLKSWQVKNKFAAAINALTKTTSDACDDDRTLQNTTSSDGKRLSIDEGIRLPDQFKSDFGRSSPSREVKTTPISTKTSLVDTTFVVAVSLQDGVVLHERGPITELLGYPKDMWIGRNLIDFIYPNDRIVFTTHVTKEVLNGSRDGDGQQHSFHCRFRKYRGLQSSGFGLDSKRMAYRTFHVSTRHADLGTDDSNGGGGGGAYVLAVVTSVESAYKMPKEIPSMRPFTTRHSASCHFSHIDTSAIPYLGYLPQDILGNSIFDYYHPEDLPHLQEVYEQVLKEENRLFRSKPYRFLARNGHYVLLETEWTSFINPWNLKLEFVIGQHRIIEGPKERDVFADADQLKTCVIPNAVLEEGKNIQTEIKQILRETVKRVFNESSQENRKRRKELAKYVGNLLEEMVQTLDVDVDMHGKSLKEDKSFSDHGSIVMGHISPHHQGTPSEPSSATLPSYHRCNYDDNIQRYFDSRPKTHSTDESRQLGGCISSPAQTDDDGGGVGGTGPGATSIPADSGDDGSGPSIECSSSVQLERRRSRSGYCETAATTVKPTTVLPQTSQSAPLPPFFSSVPLPDVGNLSKSICPSYVRVALTERILSKHNEVTEKTFIQQVRDIRSAATSKCRRHSSCVLPVMSTATMVVPSAAAVVLPDIDRRTVNPVVHRGGIRLKRSGSHSPDLDTHKVNKHHHVESSETRKFSNPMVGKTVNLWPPFSITPSTYSTMTPVVDSRNSAALLTVPPNVACMMMTPSCDQPPLPVVVAMDIPPTATHFLVPVQFVKSIGCGLTSSDEAIEPRTFPAIVREVTLYQPASTAVASSVLTTKPSSAQTVTSLHDRFHFGLHIATHERKMVQDCRLASSEALSTRNPVMTAKLDFTNMMRSSSLVDRHHVKIQNGESSVSGKGESITTTAGSYPRTSVVNATQPPMKDADGSLRLKIIAHSTTDLNNANVAKSSSSSSSSSSSLSSQRRRPPPTEWTNGCRQFDGLLLDDLTGSSLNSFLRSDLDISDCGSMRTMSSAEERLNSQSEIEGSKKGADEDYSNSKTIPGKPVRRSVSYRNQKLNPSLQVKKEPCWMEDVRLTEDMISGYRMPCRDIYDVLGDDVDKLRRMSQPDAVNEQLARLYDEVDSHRRRVLHGADHEAAAEDVSQIASDDDNKDRPDVDKSNPAEAMFAGQGLDDISVYLLEDLDW